MNFLSRCIKIFGIVGLVNDVTQLQQRTKWSESLNENVKVTLIRDIIPPLQWHLERITEVHPGKNGLIRTVTIKT